MIKIIPRMRKHRCGGFFLLHQQVFVFLSGSTHVTIQVERSATLGKVPAFTGLGLAPHHAACSASNNST